MWEDGGYATEGVKRLAEFGSPVVLQREMRLQVRCGILHDADKQAFILGSALEVKVLPLAANFSYIFYPSANKTNMI